MEKVGERGKVSLDVEDGVKRSLKSSSLTRVLASVEGPGCDGTDTEMPSRAGTADAEVDVKAAVRAYSCEGRGTLGRESSPGRASGQPDSLRPSPAVCPFAGDPPGGPKAASRLLRPSASSGNALSRHVESLDLVSPRNELRRVWYWSAEGVRSPGRLADRERGSGTTLSVEGAASSMVGMTLTWTEGSSSHPCGTPLIAGSTTEPLGLGRGRTSDESDSADPPVEVRDTAVPESGIMVDFVGRVKKSRGGVLGRRGEELRAVGVKTIGEVCGMDEAGVRRLGEESEWEEEEGGRDWKERRGV